MAFKIRILSPPARTLEAEPGQSLSRALIRGGLPLNAYCGGRGLCGKCLVEIADGPLPPPLPEEAHLLERLGAAPRFRLACLFPVQGDLSVSIPPNALVSDIQGLTDGMLASFEFDPAVKLFRLEPGWTPLEAGLTEADAARVLKLPVDDAWRNESWPVLAEALRTRPAMAAHGLTAAVYDERTVLDAVPGGAPAVALGLAVDLGTTTVVVELVDLADGRILDRTIGLNGQARFGADVISRIYHACLGPAQAAELREAAVETLSVLVARLFAGAEASSRSIYDIAVAGNTAMNHLFLGRSVRSLAEAPFEADFSILPPLAALSCGLPVHPRARLFVSPNIASYVGGDITAGLLATGLLQEPGNRLFIDLGTNGEIVLKAGASVLTASTAAGPAFEGASLSCGMLAVPGAVDRAQGPGDPPLLSTIGNRPAVGICGTGYIDLLAHFLHRGLISRSGLIAGGRASLPVDRGLSVSQKDIRDLQLAVAAVRTGVELLLKRSGLRARDLDGIYLAGAFGNRLDLDSARAIGLLPEIGGGPVRFVGNTSLAGARAMLLSRSARAEAVRIAGRIIHVPLASDAAFQDTYIRSLIFPGMEDRL
jgi:uncharacterized 2Fe-2S/4Fe-4S cluster protein (DUF4445 family)